MGTNAPGEWSGDVEEWTTPFTEDQTRKLTATPAVVDGRWVCVQTRVAYDATNWLVCQLPADEEMVTCASPKGVMFEVQFGTMTTAEIEGLREFDGW